MINFAESKWYNIATVVWDVIAMGFLWTIFSLLGLGITIGASTTALYYIATKKASGKDDEYIFSAFWKSFKENLIKSTIAFLTLILIGIVIWFNLNLLSYIDMGWLNLPIRVALYFMLIQLIFVTLYIFAVIARFEMSILDALKAAGFMANRHVMMTLSNFILLFVIVYISFFAPIVLLFMMGIYGYFSSFLIVRIFRKHRPDFDMPNSSENSNLIDE